MAITLRIDNQDQMEDGQIIFPKKFSKKFNIQRKTWEHSATPCMDFIDFVLPPEPSVLYFYEPCDDVLFARVLEKIRISLREHPRPLYLIYMAPRTKEALLDAADFLVKGGQNAQFKFCWYRNR